MRPNVHEWSVAKTRRGTDAWVPGSLTQTQSRMHRQQAKSINFSMIYGMRSGKTSHFRQLQSDRHSSYALANGPVHINIDYSEAEKRVLQSMSWKLWECVHCGLQIHGEETPAVRSTEKWAFIPCRYVIMPLSSPPAFPDCYDMVVDEVMTA